MGCGPIFLLGGNIEVFDLIADDFLAAAGGSEAAIALLLIGGEGWERHLPSYTAPWRRRGVTDLQVIIPGVDGLLDAEAASARIREATGIVVGGGNTARYQWLYATEPIRTVIRERHQLGVPYAGLSAGAALAAEACAVRPRSPGDPPVRLLPGLGLIGGLIIGVHFDREGQLALLLKAMAETETGSGLGIDESACVVLADGVRRRVVGGAVHEITASDLKAGRYSITTLV